MVRDSSEGFLWARPGLKGWLGLSMGLSGEMSGLALTQLPVLGKACKNQGRGAF